MLKNSDEKKNNKRLVGYSVAWIIVLIVAFVAGVLAGALGLGERVSQSEILLGINKVQLFGGIFLGYFIAIIVHELGHFICGKITGHELVIFVLGIFKWSRENEKLKFSVQKPKGYEGLCSMVANDDKINSAFIHLFGGICFNFILGAICFLNKNLFFSGSSIISIYLYSIGGVSIFMGIINLIPFTTGGAYSDGMLLWSIVLNKPLKQKILIDRSIDRQLVLGARPKEVVIEYEEDSLKEMDLFEVIFAKQMYYKQIDLKDLEKASYYMNMLEQNVDKIVVVYQNAVKYEICFFASLMGDYEKAKDYYNQTKKILEKEEDITGERVKAYYYFYVENDRQKALECCNKGIAIADKFIYKGQAEMEEELINELVEKIKNEKSNSVKVGV